METIGTIPASSKYQSVPTAIKVTGHLVRNDLQCVGAKPLSVSLNTANKKDNMLETHELLVTWIKEDQLFDFFVKMTPHYSTDEGFRFFYRVVLLNYEKVKENQE